MVVHPYGFKAQDLPYLVEDLSNTLNELSHLWREGAREWAHRAPELLSRFEMLLMAATEPKVAELGWPALLLLGGILFISGVLVAAILCLKCGCGDSSCYRAREDKEAGQQPTSPVYIPFPVYIRAGESSHIGDRDVFPDLGVSRTGLSFYSPELIMFSFFSSLRGDQLRPHRCLLGHRTRR